MKRFISAFLVMVLVIGSLPNTAMAADLENQEVITYLEDGSYMIDVIYTSKMRASNTVSGSKERTYYTSDGETEWKVVLYGTFTYTGSAASCTASSCNVTIYNSNWYVISKTASKSGASATASVTMGLKLLGVTINKVSTNLTLSCSANGSLS